MRLSTSTIYNMNMQSILQQQSRVADVGQKLASGKEIVTPADDPRGASQALVVSQSAAVNEQFAASRSTAKRDLSAEENELNTVVNALNAAKPLLVKAGNGTLSDADRSSVATELKGVYQQILGSANAQDGNGRYLFAGFDGDARPFAETAGGVTYQGDQGSRKVQVDSSRQIVTSDSGSDIFTSVTNSANYVATADGGNTGTAVYTDLSVTDAQAGDYGDTFEVSFGSAGTQKTYTVTNTSTSTVVTAGQIYTEGEPIAVGGGLQATFEGKPETGDRFVVARDRAEDNNIFNTLAGVIDRLEAGTDTPAKSAVVQNTINSANRKVDNTLDNVLTVRASVGSRLGELDTLDTVGESRALNYQSTLSQLQDLDYVPAISEYSLAQVALQFSQKTFTDIQQMSLFSMS